LIVEDDVDTAELLRLQIESGGVDVDIARNGQEAILVTGEQPPDLVIMDVMMPRLNGFETTRFFKAKFRDAYVPVLILSAKDAPEDIANGARYGCDDYMTKPYRRQEIRSAVEDMLEIGKLENGVGSRVERESDSDEGAAEPGKAETVSALVAVRLKVAERLISRGLGEVAKGHLGRILDLNPGHKQADSLLNQIGE
jgi:DNA-binding response OmpR family regulator